MIFYVYEHWRPDINMCFYVGKGSGNRAFYLHSRTLHHRNIVALLERLGLCIEIRFVAKDLSEDIALAVEKGRIAYWRNLGIKLVNLNDGGKGNAGRIVSNETRLKLKESGKSRMSSPEVRRELSEKTKALWRIPEFRQKYADARKGRPGHKLTAEAKEKIREAHLGIKFSDAHKIALSLAKKGRKLKSHSPEAIERHRIAAKLREERRRQLGTNRHTPETRAKISAIQRGRPGRRHTPQEIEANRLRGLGRKASESTRRKMSISQSGKIWITDGIRNIKIVIGQDIPIGWKRGIVHRIRN